MLFQDPGFRHSASYLSYARGVALALSIGCFLLLPAEADDWVMAFHDSRHTGQSSEVVTPPLTLAWTWKDTLTYDTGDGGKFTPLGSYWLPVYYQGKIYLQGGNNANRVFCLNPANGAPVWTWSNAGYAQAGTYLFQFNNYPVAIDGRIVNASSDFSTSIDAGAGATTESTYNTNGGWPAGGSAVWNGMAFMQYVRTDDSTESFHVVLDPVAWTMASPFSYFSPDHVNTFTDASFRVPAVDNYTAYVNMLGQLNAFNATTGWQMWTYGKMDYGSSPAVANGIVYFYATNAKQMVALNPAAATFPSSGAQVPALWSVSMPVAYSPIVSGGTLYVGAADGNFYALNAATGAVEWTFQTGKPFGALQIPAISGNLVYVPGADGTLYALQKSTGVEVWHYSGTAAWGPVIVAGGMVFAGDLSNTFYAFQPQAAATGPAVTALSTTFATNDSAASITITGSGFFGGGTASAVQTVYLDNSAQTPLTGYAVASDQSITGAVIPAGVAPGVYHIKVQTSVGVTANEPSFTVGAANTVSISTLGHSTGPNSFGTNLPFQRHLVRTSNGTLVAVYIGPETGETQYPTYNFSFDGGFTWSGQGLLFLSNSGSVIYDPTTTIWVDAQDQISISSIQWPSYNQMYQKYAFSPQGLLIPDSGFPVYPSGGSADYPAPVVSEPGGRLWMALEVGGNLTGYYSDNGGLNWTATAQINQKTATSPTMVLYQGFPAVIYSDGGFLAWSAWNGQAWSAPQALPGSIANVGQAMSAVVTSGQIALVYSTSKGGVYLTAYSGQSWSAPAALDAAGTSPSLTTDGTNLWAFYANASGNLVYRETSNGQWNAAVALTGDGNQNTAPTTLSVSLGGMIPVLWTSGSSATGYWVKAATIPAAGGVVPPPPPSTPVLTVAKTHSGSFSQGQKGAAYTVTVSNAASAGATSGTVTVTDTEPAGLTLVSMTGNGWTCSGTACTRGDVLNGGSSYPPISVTVNIAANAALSVTSQAGVSGGGSASATASDVTAITPVPPVLTVSKAHTGNFYQGQTGAAYSVVVSNGSSAGPTASPVTVSDIEPAGLALVSMTGSGWLCTAGICQRSDTLNGGSSWPPITVTVNVAANAAASLTSQSIVAGGGSSTATASDVTTITPVTPALTITKNNAAHFSQGQSGATYTVTVSNAASASATAGTVTVTDTEPDGLTLVSMAGSGWTCTGTACTRSDALSGGASYPPITVTVNVDANAAATVTSQASVAGGGSAPATASDLTTITAVCAFSTPDSVTLTNAVPISGTPATQPFSLVVNPRGGCTSSITWTAATGPTTYWLSLSAGAAGNGSGAVTIQGNGLANTETLSRTGAITITPSAGSPMTVQVVQPAVATSTSPVNLEVTALYQTVLGRDPDASGYAFWTGGGLTGLGQMLDSFVTSEEGFNTGFAVMVAYQAATGNAPTYAQFATAVGAVRQGAQTVGGLFGSLAGPSYTVTTLYSNLLGRTPTSSEISQANSAGLGAWFQTLIGYPANTTPAAAANNEFQSTGSFANHASAAGDHTNALFVRMLYYTILLRDPDPAGLLYWVGVANSGGAGILFQGATTLGARLLIEGTGPGEGFAGSPEFQALY